MNSELIEAIRELGKTSPLDIISVGIGIIGTFLTLIVLYYNHKSIQLTQKTMQQTIGLQLYEKRLELYNAITDERAFSKEVPISLKIVYTEEIYRLYSDIAELCEKRWAKMWAFAQIYNIGGWDSWGHGNVCHELYRSYDQLIEKEIEAEKEGALPRYTKDGKVFSLENNKANVDSLHDEICKKYAELEEKMRTILNQSMKV